MGCQRHPRRVMLCSMNRFIPVVLLTACTTDPRSTIGPPGPQGPPGRIDSGTVIAHLTNWSGPLRLSATELSGLPPPRAADHAARQADIDRLRADLSPVRDSAHIEGTSWTEIPGTFIPVEHELTTIEYLVLGSVDASPLVYVELGQAWVHQLQTPERPTTIGILTRAVSSAGFGWSARLLYRDGLLGLEVRGLENRATDWSGQIRVVGWL